MEHVPNADTIFSHNRIRTIMKSVEDTNQITSEVIFIMTKSAELFVQHLAREAMKLSKDKTLNYDCLSKLVNDEKHLEFLLQIIPQKISVREFKELMEESSDSDDSDDESSESSKESQ